MYITSIYSTKIVVFTASTIVYILYVLRFLARVLVSSKLIIVKSIILLITIK